MLNKLLHSLNLFFSNPAITTLVGILLGSFLTFFTTGYFEKKRMLVEFYADFLNAYSRCVPKPESLDDIRHLTISIEKMRLICPKAAKPPLDLIYAAAPEGFWSPETVLPAYESLWNVMKKILHA